MAFKGAEQASVGLGGGRAGTWGVEDGPHCVPGALGEAWLIICKATGSLGIKTRFLVYSVSETQRKCVFLLEAWQMCA